MGTFVYKNDFFVVLRIATAYNQLDVTSPLNNRRHVPVCIMLRAKIVLKKSLKANFLSYLSKLNYQIFNTGATKEKSLPETCQSSFLECFRGSDVVNFAGTSTES
jgi:hypothetical protein